MTSNLNTAETQTKIADASTFFKLVNHGYKTCDFYAEEFQAEYTAADGKAAIAALSPDHTTLFIVEAPAATPTADAEPLSVTANSKHIQELAAQRAPCTFKATAEQLVAQAGTCLAKLEASGAEPSATRLASNLEKHPRIRVTITAADARKISRAAAERGDTTLRFEAGKLTAANHSGNAAPLTVTPIHYTPTGGKAEYTGLSRTIQKALSQRDAATYTVALPTTPGQPIYVETRLPYAGTAATIKIYISAKDDGDDNDDGDAPNTPATEAAAPEPRTPDTDGENHGEDEEEAPGNTNADTGNADTAQPTPSQPPEPAPEAAEAESGEEADSDAETMQNSAPVSGQAPTQDGDSLNTEDEDEDDDEDQNGGGQAAAWEPDPENKAYQVTVKLHRNQEDETALFVSEPAANPTTVEAEFKVRGVELGARLAIEALTNPARFQQAVDKSGSMDFENVIKDAKDDPEEFYKIVDEAYDNLRKEGPSLYLEKGEYSNHIVVFNGKEAYNFYYDQNDPTANAFAEALPRYYKVYPHSNYTNMDLKANILSTPPATLFRLGKAKSESRFNLKQPLFERLCTATEDTIQKAEKLLKYANDTRGYDGPNPATQEALAALPEDELSNRLDRILREAEKRWAREQTRSAYNTPKEIPDKGYLYTTQYHNRLKTYYITYDAQVYVVQDPRTQTDKFFHFLKHGPTPQNTVKAPRYEATEVLEVLAETQPQYKIYLKLAEAD